MLTEQVTHEITAKVRLGSVLIVVGATGSGKSTGIPQALLKTTGDKITVTQPRRVAAIALASYVGRSAESGVVGHKVRFSDTTSHKTRLRYVTDGILLKEMEEKVRLSTVIIDEVHERSIRTDILLGLLKKKIKTIRLVLMSATADINMLTEYFARDKIPVEYCEIPTQKHTVKINYLPRKSSDYIQLAYDTVKKIMKNAKDLKNKQTENNIPDAQQITHSSSACNKKEPATKDVHNSKNSKKSKSKKANNPQEELDEMDCIFAKKEFTPKQVNIPDGFTCGTILVFLSGLEDIEDLFKMLEKHSGLEILKLHSSLSDTEQKLIFTRRKSNIRVILSTNIAETSLTIEDVRWVIDSGVQKINISKDGIDSLGIVKISKSSAQQRTGRAGRVGPGICYRLYTECAYNLMHENNIPEIMRADISSVSLSLIQMGIDPEVFDFLEAPNANAILSALAELFILGLIDENRRITELGKKVSKLPLSPSLGKFLLIGKSLGAGHASAAVCALLAGDRISLFSKEVNTSTIVSVHNSPSKCSDLTLYASVFFTYLTYSARLKVDFCQSLGLSLQEMRNSEKIYKQLTLILELNPGIESEIDETEDKHTLSCIPLRPIIADRLHTSASAGFMTRVAEMKGNAYMHIYSEKQIYVHPSSSMFSRKEGSLGFIVTSETTKPYILHVFPYIPNEILVMQKTDA
ncbi:uncharacterized protein NESG_01909 [Nematocida ausubeli]|uniref:RNA helicase n=1 Tax=Nematocida ausubeli (strain ATCC PRA-371 / ERTm2) TaxID=1913371 RepID=A0A086J1A2_NEMA1|nr:uncharacterized protein NESG_01909 [Nematocida ausubeli]KFG25920.1 hypothetical protein NESG_01909 [Nematocida ausubeli]